MGELIQRLPNREDQAEDDTDEGESGALASELYRAMMEHSRMKKSEPPRHPCQVAVRSAWQIGSARLIDLKLGPAMLGVGVTATGCTQQARQRNLQFVVVLNYE